MDSGNSCFSIDDNEDAYDTDIMQIVVKSRVGKTITLDVEMLGFCLWLWASRAGRRRWAFGIGLLAGVGLLVLGILSIPYLRLAFGVELLALGIWHWASHVGIPTWR